MEDWGLRREKGDAGRGNRSSPRACSVGRCRGPSRRLEWRRRGPTLTNRLQKETFGQFLRYPTERLPCFCHTDLIDEKRLALTALPHACGWAPSFFLAPVYGGCAVNAIGVRSVFAAESPAIRTIRETRSAGARNTERWDAKRGALGRETLPR